MKRWLQFTIFFVVGVAAFFVIFWKVGFNNIEEALRLFFNLQGLSIIALTILSFVIAVVRSKVILKSQGHNFSFKQLSPSWLIGYAVSYLTPFTVFGGEPARAWLLKKQFPELSWEKSAASIAIDKIIDTTVFFIFIIAGLFAFSFFGVFPGSILAGSTVVVSGIFIALLVIFYFKSYKKESAIEWLLDIFDIRLEKLKNFSGKSGVSKAEKVLRTEAKTLRFFSFRKKRFWQALLLTILRYIVLLAKAWLLVFFISKSINIAKAAAVFSFVNLAGLTPVPANLGTLEIGQGLAFKGLGFNFDLGTVFSLVWRGSELVLCLLGGIISIKVFADLLHEKILNRFKKC